MLRADNLIMCRLSWNLGALSSWNPQGLSRPVHVWFKIPFFTPSNHESASHILILLINYSTVFWVLSSIFKRVVACCQETLVPRVLSWKLYDDKSQNTPIITLIPWPWFSPIQCKCNRSSVSFNFYVFPQETGKQNILNRTVKSISWTQSDINFSWV